MIEWLLQPWPWWFSGVLIGLMVPALYLLLGKGFGISTSLRHLGSICFPNSTLSYLKNNNWRLGIWNIILVIGIIIGGFVATRFLSVEPIQFMPASYFTFPGLLRLTIGGVFVGFGTRYAGGCTSGHTITGLSNLNLPSLVATISFFVGGVVVTWGLGWLIF